MKILATKKLKVNQRDLLLGAGFSVVDYDAITVEILDFETAAKVENAIFTSQNSVRAIANKTLVISHCFCVGEKTTALLEKNGQNVIKTALNSKELGDFLMKNHESDSFYYFCGTDRRDELPDLLKAAKIELFEVKTYKTVLKPKKFQQKWDGILFFSPSGVESFCMENSLDSQAVFCIGETTASAARAYTNQVHVANTTTIESVIAKAVKKLNMN